MRILITGIAGFVGTKMAEYCRSAWPDAYIVGIDNLSRKGAVTHIPLLKAMDCVWVKGDISNRNDMEALPEVDWVIDCAANPSVLAGRANDSLPLIQDNLIGTVYILEKCKRDKAGLILISTSRVYSIATLNNLPLKNNGLAFTIDATRPLPPAITAMGVTEKCAVTAPISLYGATKLASEVMALEYHHSFGFPVWINRCGVLAGAGQLGKIDQGIFSFWIYQYLLDRPLSFIGYGGTGMQARDMLHPEDLFKLIWQQIMHPITRAPQILNVGGGLCNTMSLAELDAYCKTHIDAEKKVNRIQENRPYDIPYYCTDYTLAKDTWGWEPKHLSITILDEILKYGRNHLDFIKTL
ncbi:MAG: NAD-dependent epimerase/dehydratase family protein [Sphingobacteriales bacterium]|uniref:NAD-dependent epimerase/dehydratase family protein n=1 Tax=Hydrotalea flava TaxID=714549 RepID=UPI000833EBC2|nr:NAD-dependent epimerase/dehydratase family protein [Hydrotalea flava]RTL49088.1 MAG: NAD-dependent epimerase/dehydratase family protein [Sphingobacteriales bacterium]